MLGSFLRPKKRPDYYIPPFWGDGADGILDDDASITYQDEVDFDKYTGFCIKQFKEINWNPTAEETLTVDEPCRGLILFSQGDVHIGANATISMAKMGSILPANSSELFDFYGDSIQMRHIVDTLKTLHGGDGGDGGNGGGYSGGSPGTGGHGGEGRVCQGGRGAGPGGLAYGGLGGDGGDVIHPECGPQNGHNSDAYSVNGADGWNGGVGGMAYPGSATFPASPGRSYGAGPGGGSLDGTRGGDGEHTGGLILIIAKGSVTITGTIDVTGGNGGNGGIGTYSGGGGGGAGGGVVAIFAKGTINTSSATKTLIGGTGGTGYQNGTSGSDGTYYEEQI